MPFSYESLLHSNDNNAAAVTETFLDEKRKCEQLQPRRNTLTSEEMKNAINNLAKMTEEMGMDRDQFDDPKLKGNGNGKKSRMSGSPIMANALRNERSCMGPPS